MIEKTSDKGHSDRGQVPVRILQNRGGEETLTGDRFLSESILTGTCPLSEIAEPLDQLLRKQEVEEGETYRPMHFVVEQPVDDGLLLYHTMTKAMLLLSPGAAELYRNDPTALPQLIEQWFLVPTAYDDRLLSRQVRDVAKLVSEEKKGITGYTILTTTDCNARCFYCYEKGRPRRPMTDETALRTAQYIIDHCERQKVSLSWFGGSATVSWRRASTIRHR